MWTAGVLRSLARRRAVSGIRSNPLGPKWDQWPPPTKSLASARSGPRGLSNTTRSDATETKAEDYDNVAGTAGQGRKSPSQRADRPHAMCSKTAKRRLSRSTVWCPRRALCDSPGRPLVRVWPAGSGVRAGPENESGRPALKRGGPARPHGVIRFQHRRKINCGSYSEHTCAHSPPHDPRKLLVTEGLELPKTRSCYEYHPP